MDSTKYDTFEDSELWNLDATIIRFALPRLKAFISNPVAGYPTILERDYPDCKDYTKLWWENILPKMVEGMEEYLNSNTFELSEGMKLFFKYFTSLWT